MKIRQCAVRMTDITSEFQNSYADGFSQFSNYHHLFFLSFYGLTEYPAYNNI